MKSNPFYFSWDAACVVMSLILAYLFYVLRTKSSQDALTRSQKWGMSLLWAIFLINGIEIVFMVTIFYIQSPVLPKLYYITIGLEHANYFLIICFGLVFPRPIVSWKKLRIIIPALMTGSFIVTIHGMITQNIMYYEIYFLSVFLVPLIWLWQSIRERSEQCRMLLSILSWGFIFTPYSNEIYNMSSTIIIHHEKVNVLESVPFFMVFVITGIIVYTLWVRRGKWATSDWFNAAIFLSAIILALGIVSSDISQNNNFREMSPISVFPGGHLYYIFAYSWMIVRPFLFSFGLLRYQLFGTTVDVKRYVQPMGWIIFLMFIAALPQSLLPTNDPLIHGAVFSVSFIALAYPVWILVRKGIARLLPLTAHETSANMAEKRDAYLIGLQTAVIDGKVEEAEDSSALAVLRERLKISDKEHELMLTFFPKSEEAVTKPEVQGLFLILADGRLVSHAGKMEGDPDLVAGMLTAIRGFVDEGLQGGRKELGAVKYGDYTLVMESEGSLVLAALVLGPETPDVRVLLRDTLTDSFRLRGAELKNWDGTLERLKGLPELLTGALAPAGLNK